MFGCMASKVTAAAYGGHVDERDKNRQQASLLSDSTPEKQTIW
ncbi:hypothetical protein EDC64_11527 [Aquabacter spiritensis]|uniref:Uncharacterized protein n=1 Tax=Aquabacter spiritensis TaxID=933073 RepID=A0A4R3LQL4_9HYPH|nr:hypothetical protein EDC64_11527 [Aquabacter spiritensis]